MARATTISWVLGLLGSLLVMATCCVVASDSTTTPWDDAVAVFNDAVAAYNCGQLEDALTLFGEALPLFRDLNEYVVEATILKNMGIVYCRLDRYEEALVSCQAARDIFVANSMNVSVAEVDQNTGVAYRQLGRYGEALAAYQAARNVFVENEMDVRVAGVDQNIGVVYRQLGRYEEALAVYQAARDVYVENDLPVEIAKTDHNIGNVYCEFGWYEEALAAYQAAWDVYVGNDMVVDIAGIDKNIGVVYDGLSKYEEALAAYQAARDVYVEHKMDVNVAGADQNIGNVYYNLGRYEEALAAYQVARDVYAENDMVVDVARIDQSIGVTYTELCRYEDALDVYRSALALLDETPPLAGMQYSYPATRWMIWANMGRAYEALREWGQARAGYDCAIAVIESIRGGLASEELKVAWQGQTQYVYELLIDLLYRTEQGASALSYAERCRARTFLDLVAAGPLGTLENVAEEGIRTGIVDVTAIECDLQVAIAGLPSDTVAVEYLVTDSSTYVWIIGRDSVSGPVQFHVGHATLMDQVIACRETIETQDPAADFYLAALYDVLIPPIESLLPPSDCGDQVPHLVIIPSGPLYYLPFQALLSVSDDREQRVRLIERYRVSYAPSLATLGYARQQATRVDNASLIALTDPESGDSALGRLPEAQTESQRVALLFPTAEVYVGADATESVVQSRSATATDLLFSTHGSFNTINPMYSYLLLSPTDDSDGRLHTYEVLGLPLSSDLVVLSACETLLPAIEYMVEQVRTTRDMAADEPIELTVEQLETLTAGDEIAGLTRAFLYAGTSAVLSSLWSVYSQATADLMVAFYEGIHAGSSKAEALRDAQLQILNTPGYEHPVYWAAFNLMGDWR